MRYSIPFMVVFLLFLSLLPVGLSGSSADTSTVSPVFYQDSLEQEPDVPNPEVSPVSFVRDEDGYIQEVLLPSTQESSKESSTKATNEITQRPSQLSVDASSYGFLSTWDTRKVSEGSSNSLQIHLPLVSSGTYDFTVDWDDGTQDQITSFNQPEINHTYSVAGVYNLNISGIINGWSFNNGGDKLKLLEISNWGPLQLGNSGSAFYGASNLVLTTTEPLNLTGTTNLERTFMNASSLGTGGNLGSWNTTGVTSMGSMFRYASSFDQNLSSWDVSSVTSMAYMFGSRTTSIEPEMAFNSDISSWNVSSVQIFEGMFSRAVDFNVDISGWNTSSALTLQDMFFGATAFNQPLNSWDLSNVGNLRGFLLGTSYNFPVDSWNTSNVYDMSGLFYDTPFNYPVSNLDTSNVERLAQTFSHATAFNQSLNSWNVSKVYDMYALFDDATSFNQPLDQWDTSSLKWGALVRTFIDASSFNQDLGSWNVSKVTRMGNMLVNTGMSSKNYDSTLIGWSTQSLEQDVLLDAHDLLYTRNGASARQYIIDTYNWKIVDRGMFELTNPEISHPDDITFDESSSGNIIEWQVGDQFPFYYLVLKDGEFWGRDTWENGTISVDLDGLPAGFYNFSLTVYDATENSSSDTVMVTVEPIEDNPIDKPTESSDDSTNPLSLTGINFVYVSISLITTSIMVLHHRQKHHR